MKGEQVCAIDCTVLARLRLQTASTHDISMGIALRVSVVTTGPAARDTHTRDVTSTLVIVSSVPSNATR